MRETQAKAVLLIFLAIALVFFLVIGLRTAFTLNSSLDQFEDAAMEFQTEWEEYQSRVKKLEDRVERLRARDGDF